MAKKAVEMLLKPQWAGKIVFELAEAIDVTKDPNIPVTLQRLRAEGVGCFWMIAFPEIMLCYPSDRLMLMD